MISQTLSRRLRPKNQAGFSLVEVTLAIGIVAFAFVALFGLVPTGLNVFRSAIDTSIGSTILQQVVENAQQTDYDALISASGLSGSGNNGNSQSGVLSDTCYDEQGDQVMQSDGTPLPGTGGEPAARAREVYRVHVKVTVPTKIPASSQDAGTATTMNVATLLVQIAKNPGHADQPFTDANKANVNNFVAYVSRNKTAL